MLIEMAKKGTVRFLLFVGPPGTGKTSAARLFAAEYLGVDYDLVEKSAITPGAGTPYYREINASDERKMDDLKNLIDMYIKRRGEKARIVVFDEADGFPWQSQDFLRASIERYSDRCIFIFCLNKIERMHEAIVSRATVIYFDPINPRLVEDWLRDKCSLFDIEATDEAIRDVVKYFKGDMRSIVNKFLFPFSGNKVTEFKPRPTYAEEIYRARDRVKAYEKIIKEHNIDHQELIYDLFVLHGKKNAPAFFRASEMIKGLNGVHPEIAMFFLFEEGLK